MLPILAALVEVLGALEELLGLEREIFGNGRKLFEAALTFEELFDGLDQDGLGIIEITLNARDRVCLLRALEACQQRSDGGARKLDVALAGIPVWLLAHERVTHLAQEPKRNALRIFPVQPQHVRVRAWRVARGAWWYAYWSVRAVRPRPSPVTWA
jgi:hypothetical protein